VDGQTNRLDGSKSGGSGGEVWLELFKRTRWIGDVAGLDAEGPVVGGVEETPGSSPTL
jgi:hypothetical protein